MSRVKKIARKIIPERHLRRAEDVYRLNKAKAANSLYGHPAKNLKIIAVTGTNGKTTTCSFINEVLKAGGYKTAVLTTAYNEIGGRVLPNTNHMTVASPWSVQRFLGKAKRAGAEWVVLEVTSHALDQYRIYGVTTEVAVVTNLSQDHLDYHKTMQNYAEAKARLITDFCPKYTLLNADDEWFEFFARKVKKGLVTIGRGRAKCQIKGLKFTSSGSEFSLVCTTGVLRANINLIGEFNCYNAAMAAVVGQIVGVDSQDISQGLANVPVVPGRLEPVVAGQSFTVMVDYAHTPDALKRVLGALKMATEGNVSLVFGATGDRDKSKRPIMGEIAAQYADKIYLTDDETYTENPETIRRAVEEGIEQAGGMGKTVIVDDRREAIKAAFKDAKKGDTVLLAGIGHQDYRNMGGKKMPWDERVIAKELLQEILSN